MARRRSRENSDYQDESGILEGGIDEGRAPDFRKSSHVYEHFWAFVGYADFLKTD